MGDPASICVAENDQSKPLAYTCTHMCNRTHVCTPHTRKYLILLEKKQREDLKDNTQKDDFKILQVYDNLRFFIIIAKQSKIKLRIKASPLFSRTV